MFWIYLPPSNRPPPGWHYCTTEVNLLFVTVLLAGGVDPSYISLANLWYPIPQLSWRMTGGCVVWSKRWRLGRATHSAASKGDYCTEYWAKVQHMTSNSRGPADMTPRGMPSMDSSWTRAYPNLWATQCRSLAATQCRSLSIGPLLRPSLENGLVENFSTRLSELGPETDIRPIWSLPMSVDRLKYLAPNLNVGVLFVPYITFP